MKPKCPKGHKLPHSTDQGECTPVYCTQDSDDIPEDTQLVKHTATDEARNEVAKLVARHKVRTEAIGGIPPLSGVHAEEYVTKKFAELSVDAAAEMEWQLKYGDTKMRFAASQYVLDSTGHGKKADGQTMGAQPIIIITGSQDGKYVPPWSKAKVVDVQAVASLPESST